MAIVLAGGAIAQIATGEIPQACLSPCQTLLDLGNTCIVEYPEQGSSPRATACLCNAIDGLGYTSCTSCLTSAAPALAQSLSQLSTFCTDFVNGCKYECAFETCAAADVQCQCQESYLQGIYNCASCNSAHNNANSTLLADYNALRDSCVNQGHTGTPTGAEPIPTPSGTIPYTGGGLSISTARAASTTGTATRITNSLVSQSASATVARTGGSSTGGSPTASSIAGGSTALAGDAVKVEIGIMGSSVGPLIALLLTMVIIGELV